MNRRRFLAHTARQWPHSSPARRRAQTWPSRNITFVVPFPPGGSNDVFARAIADKLSAALGVAGDHRQPRRRRRHHRLDRGRAHAARWLHADDRAHRHARRQSEPLSEPALRHADELRLRRAARPRAEHPRRASRAAGEVRAGTHRLCPCQSGQAQLQHRRQRQRRRYRHGRLQRRGEDPDGAGALSRHRAGADRPPRRPGAAHHDRQHRGAPARAGAARCAGSASPP